MRIIGINNLVEGSVIARPIYDESMQLIVNRGVVLNLSLIDNLRDRGYKYVYIQEEGTEGIEVEDTVSVDTSRQVAREMDNTFHAIRNLTCMEKNTLRIVADRLTVQKRFANLAPKGSFRKKVVNLVQELFNSNRQSIDSFSLSMLGANPLSHAMDVTMLSILLGKRFFYDIKELVQLADSALLHDCGMQFLPEINGKPYFLYNEEERADYLTHPVLGHNMLDYLRCFSPMETQTILHHHENQDGNGFPSGLRGNNDEPLINRSRVRGNIFRWAEIIAVADRYLRYCSGDLTEIPKTPPQAISAIIQESGTILNLAIVRELGNIVNVYPNGAGIRVLDSRDESIIGFEGVVCKENPYCLDRPQVVLLHSRKGIKIKPTVVDFANDGLIKLEIIC